MDALNVSLVKYAIGVAIGVLISGWAVQSFFISTLTQLIPEYQTASTSVGFIVIWSLILAAGITIACVSLFAGIGAAAGHEYN